ncbi:hypothetical protein [Saccharopolyspora hattusasensis]|uniref:hypothetical protein n=1 Tax=Saccharopolyspora hattusasensis TaxID=1128679 RepID=UPI003D996DDE
MPAALFEMPEPSSPAGEQYGIWAYLAVFVLVLLSSAGVPVIGTLAVGGSAVLASQDHVALAGVLIAAVLGGRPVGSSATRSACGGAAVSWSTSGGARNNGGNSSLSGNSSTPPGDASPSSSPPR